MLRGKAAENEKLSEAETENNREQANELNFVKLFFPFASMCSLLLPLLVYFRALPV